MKRNQLLTLMMISLLSTQALSASKNKADRWFEIEVILFEQLGDKSAIKEVFAEPKPLPNYRRVIDVLTPYLQPNISALKQQLPLCSSDGYAPHLIVQASQLPHLHLEKTLLDIANLSDDYFIDENALVDDSYNDQLFNDEQASEVQNKSISDVIYGTSESSDINNTQPSIVEETPIFVLSEEDIALVQQAEEMFAAQDFIYKSHPYPSEQFCAMSENEFSNYRIENSRFTYLGFDVDKLTGTLNGTEDLTSTSSYIVAQTSLKLNDVVTKLKRSKEFKPLLHFAWRQNTKTKRKAIPIKFFAGDNLQLHYQKSLEQYQEKLELKAQEQAEQLALSVNNNDVTQIQHEVDTKSAKIAQIIERLTQPTFTNDALPLDNPQLNTELNQALVAPLAPPQPWTIDGFIKVEVDHYLHITADMNIVDKSLAQQLTTTLNTGIAPELNVIRFEQNRRVISKQIHYFDHPYVGMVIQIRAHKQIDPNDIEQEPSS